MKNHKHFLKFIMLVFLVTTSIACNDSQLVDSSSDSELGIASADSLLNHNEIQNQSSDWSDWFAYVSQIITAHAPQSHNNMDAGGIISTGYPPNFVAQVIQVDDVAMNPNGPGFVYSNRPPSVWDSYMVYKPDGSNSLRFGIISGPSVDNSQIPGATSNTGPTIVEFQSDIYVFFKGQNNAKIYMIKSSDEGDTWTSTTQLFGNTNTTVGATVFNNRIYIFHKGQSSNTIYYRYMTSNGNWSGSHSLPTSESRTPSTPTVRTNPYDNELYLVYRGEDNGIYYRTMNTNGNWTPQEQVIAVNTDVTKTSSAPDMAFGPGFQRVYYREQSTNKIVDVTRQLNTN